MDSVNHLLPVQLTQATSQFYLGKIKTGSKVIYTIILFTFFAALISLPLVYISVSVQSSAIIRPTSEITTIKPLVNGRLKSSMVYENKLIKKGETLFIIDSETMAEKEKNLLEKIKEINRFIHDYKLVLQSKPEYKNLATPLVQQSAVSYQQKIADVTTRFNKVNADFNRNKRLHQEKVIADSEFENFQFELDKVTSELELTRQTQFNQWQNELTSYEKELLGLQGELVQVQKEKNNLVIISPVSGTLQNLDGLYPGSLIFANQELAQISPDTSLVVEAYVNPNDIGLIKLHMPARFQVSAFNYNQWGLAMGKVAAISNDIYIIDEKPVFKVKCILDKEYLQLKNGYKGYLKKGMTLQARFIVTERSLWQLLYDKIDDWVNPTTYTRSN